MKFKIWLEDEEENKFEKEIREIILGFMKSTERAEVEDEDVLNQRSTMSVEDMIDDVLNRGIVKNHIPPEKIREISDLATHAPGITIGRFIDELVSSAENLPTVHSRIDPSDEMPSTDPTEQPQSAFPKSGMYP